VFKKIIFPLNFNELMTALAVGLGNFEHFLHLFSAIENRNQIIFKVAHTLLLSMFSGTSGIDSKSYAGTNKNDMSISETEVCVV